MTLRISIINCLILMFLSLYGTAIGGTVQKADLIPGEIQINPGSTAQMNFSAANDYSLALTSYSIVFRYTAGLSISNLSATPTAVTAKIDTRKNTISLSWSNVALGTELQASFEVSSVITGDYDIIPDASSYVDTDRNSFTGSCNSSQIQIRPEFIPPSAPTLLRSQSGNNSIHLSWTAPPDPDVLGYRIYRRTFDSTYDLSTYSSTSQTDYEDGGLANDTIYSYVVSAVDSYGNEGEPSAETSSMTLASKLQLLHSVSNDETIINAAMGDFMGDGQTDIVVSNGASVKIYKDGVDGKKTTLVLTSPDAEAGLSRFFGDQILVTDLNDDGIDDLIVSDPGFSLDTGNICTMGTGKVYVYPGGMDFPGAPVITILGTASYYYRSGVSTLCAGEGLGDSLARAGDINRDGYQDVIIGVPNGGGNWSGEVQVLLGGANYSSGLLNATGAQPNEHMGYHVASAGDVNGDGFNDIIAAAGSPDSTQSVDKGYLIWGGDSLQPTGISFAYLLYSYKRNVGGFDINNDGYSDILTGSSGSTAIRYGGSQLNPIPDVRVIPSLLPMAGNLNDINHDNHIDLLAEQGELYLGSSQGLYAQTDLGKIRIFDSGDFNNDGITDIIAYVGDESASISTPGPISVYSLAPFRNLPEIHISSPGIKGVTTFSTQQISGSIQGEITRLMIGGQEVAVGSDGSFAYLWTLIEGTNGIEVLAETPDNKIVKVELTLRVPPPLTLTIDSPQDGATTDQGMVQVEGMVSDPTASVTVNGIAAQPFLGYFFQAEVALTEGLNTITAIAKDSYGRSVSQCISISAIYEGSVSGIVQDSLGQALVDVNVTVQEADGTILAGATAADGSYLVSAVSQGDVSVAFEKSGYITAIENGSITTGETLIVNAQLAPIPPLILDIVSPSDGDTVMVTPVTISGNISNSLATVMVNGVTAVVANNTYQANVELMEGLNTLTAVATDPYGQSASSSITLTLITGGKITARSSGLPLEGAAVSVTDSNGIQQSVSTDANGDFLINHIAGGVFTGTVSHTEYMTDSFTGSLIPGETLTINSVLSLSPPLIGNIAVLPAMDGVVITWTTDQTADSLVEYGETTTYGQSVSDAALLTNHSLILSGLSQATAYHFKVVSANSDGSVAQSGDATFTTLALPVISNISVSNITGNSATINWTTDLPADSFVEYGESTAYGLTAGDTALSTEHHVNLTGLLSDRTYHFRVSSTSSQGAKTVSGDNQFDTVQAMILTITSPVEGEILSNSSILVQGSITGSAAEIGVTVNGVITLLDNSLYDAKHVPLLAGDNTILVRATDSDGNIAEHR